MSDSPLYYFWKKHLQKIWKFLVAIAIFIATVVGFLANIAEIKTLWPETSHPTPDPVVAAPANKEETHQEKDVRASQAPAPVVAAPAGKEETHREKDVRVLQAPDPVVTAPANIPDPLIVRASKEEIRRENGVRALQGFEDGMDFSRLPNGVFGFASRGALRRPSQVDDIRLNREDPGADIVIKFAKRVYKTEIHKTTQGKMVVLVYLAENDLMRLQDPTRKDPAQANAFLRPYKEYSRPIGIPVSRLIVWENRQMVEMNYVEIEVR